MVGEKNIVEKIQYYEIFIGKTLNIKIISSSSEEYDIM